KVHGSRGVALTRLVGMDAVEPDAVGLALEVAQGPRVAARVPLLAVHRAGVTTDAGIEIDDEAKLLLTRDGFGQAGHDAAPFDLRAARVSHGRLRPFAS